MGGGGGGRLRNRVTLQDDMSSGRHKMIHLSEARYVHTGRLKQDDMCIQGYSKQIFTRRYVYTGRLNRYLQDDMCNTGRLKDTYN